MNRALPATLLVVAVLGICVIQIALGRALTTHRAEARPERVREAQERFLASYPVLVAARDALDLSDADRAELRENDPLLTGYIGLALTPTTTTDGSLRAKRLSTDVRWVGDITAMLRGLRTDAEESDAVWIGASGSFPALTVAAVLACEAEGLTPLVISSLTASSFGANVPGFNGLTMERTLLSAGIIHHRSLAASVGGESDRGVGLDPASVAALRRSIVEQGVTLIDASTPQAAAELRIDHWRDATGALWPLAFINIGGNPANLGPEREARHLNPGLNSGPLRLTEDPQGVSARALQADVPVIHLLNIERLAAQSPLVAIASEAPRAQRIASLRRVVALLGLMLVTWWVATRLSPPAIGPLFNNPSQENAPCA